MKVFMSFTKFLGGIAGYILLTLALSITVGTLLLLSFDAHFPYLNQVISNTGSTFISENQDELFSYIFGDEEYVILLEDCEGMDIEECEFINDPTKFIDSLENENGEVSSLLEEFTKPIEQVLSYKYYFIALSTLLVLLSAGFYYFSSSKEKNVMFRRMSLVVAIYFLSLFILFLIFTLLSPSSLLSIFNNALGDVPTVIAKLAANIVLDFFQPIVEPFVYPFLAISIISFIVFFYSIFQIQSEKKKGNFSRKEKRSKVKKNFKKKN
jgi:hypothetical protein